jgi:hypothetical protein
MHWTASQLRRTIFSATLACISAGRVQAQTPFPEAWVGKWHGTLVTIAPPDSIRNRIPISLEIAREPNDTAFTWRTIFNADTVRGNRPYRLLIENAAKGLYATDESNGVLLDETFLGGVLTSVFHVQTRVLESRYTLRGDTLTHELTWWDTTPTRTVKGSGANAEGGTEISSFRVQGMQRAVMTRQPH